MQLARNMPALRVTICMHCLPIFVSTASSRQHRVTPLPDKLGRCPTIVPRDSHLYLRSLVYYKPASYSHPQVFLLGALHRNVIFFVHV
jgi:hypothetical protein